MMVLSLENDSYDQQTYLDQATNVRLMFIKSTSIVVVFMLNSLRNFSQSQRELHIFICIHNSFFFCAALLINRLACPCVSPSPLYQPAIWLSAVALALVKSCIKNSRASDSMISKVHRNMGSVHSNGIKCPTDVTRDTYPHMHPVQRPGD